MLCRYDEDKINYVMNIVGTVVLDGGDRLFYHGGYEYMQLCECVVARE